MRILCFSARYSLSADDLPMRSLHSKICVSLGHVVTHPIDSSSEATLLLSFISFSLEEAAAQSTPSKDEIKQYYDEHVNQFVTPEKRSVLQMLFETEDAAKKAWDMAFLLFLTICKRQK